jgi:hypothetical protein
MRQRGRKSAESLLVVPSAFPQRPDPPKELSPDQAELWRGYVGDMPADWFTPKTWPDLANLCGLVTECALLRSALHDYAGGLPADAEGYMRHRQIRKDYESLVLTISTLETKLRLTHQSRNDHHRTEKDRTAIANAAPGPKPWDR